MNGTARLERAFLRLLLTLPESGTIITTYQPENKMYKVYRNETIIGCFYSLTHLRTVVGASSEQIKLIARCNVAR
jgi:hypothetical protein